MGGESQRTRPDPGVEAQRWRLPTRIGFRFCFAYLGLYVLATRISGGLFLLPDRAFSSFGTLPPAREITFWAAERVFGMTGPLPYTGNSWDARFFWVQAFLVLVLASGATALWSLLDRRRANYVTLHKWFRVFVRLAIASQMFEYGVTKIIPAQFPFPSLITLVTPVGGVSMQGLFWTFVGASPTYQILTGIVEVAAGILLIVPRTATLGAVVVLASMMQVFGFNMLYDVGVKMISFHLVLMTAFLLAPESPRLWTFFFGRGPTPASNHPVLFRSRRANAAALGAQLLFGLYAIGVYGNITWAYWNQAGDGSPRSPLYGVWDVERLSIDGEARPAAVNDYDRRWRRVIFDEPGAMVFQRTDDSFARYGVTIDPSRDTLSLTKGDSRTWRSEFAFRRSGGDGLVLEGEMDGYEIAMELRLVRRDTFQLLNSHFRWVRPPDP